MNAWLTWRARVEHLLNPGNACLCDVCTAAHREDHAIAQEVRSRRQQCLIPAVLVERIHDPWSSSKHD